MKVIENAKQRLRTKKVAIARSVREALSVELWGTMTEVDCISTLKREDRAHFGSEFTGHGYRMQCLSLCTEGC